MGFSIILLLLKLCTENPVASSKSFPLFVCKKHVDVARQGQGLVVDLAVLGWRWDLMILEVFSHLNDSVVRWRARNYCLAPHYCHFFLCFHCQLQSEVEKPLLNFRENFKKDMKKCDHHIADLRKHLASRYTAVEKVGAGSSLQPLALLLGAGESCLVKSFCCGTKEHSCSAEGFHC